MLISMVVTRAYLKMEETKTEYEKRVTSYLVDEKEYDKNELELVTGLYGVKSPPYYVMVIFKDEPYAQYFYYAHNGVEQYDFRLSNEAAEKGILDESKLINYDPLRY